MSCDVESTTINNKTYTVTQWPGERSFVMQMKLLSMFGPAFMSLASGEESESDGLTVAALGKAMGILFASNSPESVVALVKESLREFTMVDGQKMMNIDSHFGSNDLMDLYRVFFFVIRTNYSNLLPSRLTGLVSAAMDGAIQINPEDTTGTP